MVGEVDHFGKLSVCFGMNSRGIGAKEPNSTKIQEKLAHPTGFESVTSAFGQAGPLTAEMQVIRHVGDN